MVRELRPVLRKPVSVLFAMVQPLVFLALFAPLLPEVGSRLGAAVVRARHRGDDRADGGSFTGANLTQEIMTGSHERLLVSPLNRSSLLVGRALKEVVPMLMQTAIILAVVTPFGFDLHLGGVLVGVAMLALFSVGLGALSFALALASKDQDWLFWTVQQTLIFPLLLLAGMLLPIEGAPGWLQVASDLNPLTYVVEAERALFAGSFAADTIAAGLPGLGAGRRARPVGRGPGDGPVELTFPDGQRVTVTPLPGSGTCPKRGRRSLARSPVGSLSSRDSEPPWAVAMVWLIARPRPRPLTGTAGPGGTALERLHQPVALPLLDAGAGVDHQQLEPRSSWLTSTAHLRPAGRVGHRVVEEHPHRLAQLAAVDGGLERTPARRRRPRPRAPARAPRRHGPPGGPRRPRRRTSSRAGCRPRGRRARRASGPGP